MPKCKIGNTWPAIHPKGCKFSEKKTKKVKPVKPKQAPPKVKKISPSKPTPTAVPSQKRRITPLAVSVAPLPPSTPSFSGGRQLTKGKESYRNAILRLEKKAAEMDKRYTKVLRR